MAGSWEQALSRARDAGVRGMLLAGVDLPGWQDQDRMARLHADLVPAYGVHPQLVAGLPEDEIARQLAALGEVLGGGPGLLRPVALGEMGLDALDAANQACL